MRLLRRYNAGAYRQPQWHVAAGDEGTKAICGTDVAAVKGDLRGAVRAGNLRSKTVEDDAQLDYSVCGRCRSKAAGGPSSPKLTEGQMMKLAEDAHAAGMKAATKLRPRPMVVGTPRDMMASLMGQPDGGLDPEQPQYFVSDGVCGFAWVTVRPANSRFAHFLKKIMKGRGDNFSGDVLSGDPSRGYRGGLDLWVGGFRQSMQLKEAYARAFAKVLREAGITAYADSRMD